MGGCACLVEIVKHVALVKQRRFRRVQIFGRSIHIECAPAECNNPPARIADRKHHPVPEAVVGYGDVLARDRQPGFGHLIDGDIPGGKVRTQGRAVIGPIAQAEFLLDGGRQLPVRQIAPCLGATCRLQFHLKELRRHFHYIIETCASLLALNISFRNLRHGKPRLHGEMLHRLGKFQAFLLDQKSEDVARGLAAEAVITALAVIDMEGRRLLAMERAARPIVALPHIGLAPVPRDLAPDHRGDRNPAANIVEKGRWKPHRVSLPAAAKECTGGRGPHPAFGHLLPWLCHGRRHQKVKRLLPCREAWEKVPKGDEGYFLRHGGRLTYRQISL